MFDDIHASPHAFSKGAFFGPDNKGIDARGFGAGMAQPAPHGGFRHLPPATATVVELQHAFDLRPCLYGDGYDRPAMLAHIANINFCKFLLERVVTQRPDRYGDLR